MAIIILLVILSLAVTGVVVSGARTQELAALGTQGQRAQFAAESAANMAVKEIFDYVDRDGDGTIGSISNDSNTATDPTISNGTRLWATRTASGSVTTITGYGEQAGNRRAMRAVLNDSGASAVAATVLLVVVNSASLDAQESAKRTLLQGWGYTVVPISESASQTQFDTAVRGASVAYISETVLPTNVGTKLTVAPIGVVTEESSLSDELGISAAMTTFTGSTMNVINTTHYITSGFPAGTLTLFTSAQPVRFLSGSFGAFTTLGRQVGTSDPTLAIMERGTTLTPSGTAAGRRVYLPWGNTGMDINQLTDDGRTIMKRAV
ncbi:MAG: hypothetical protein K2V38_04475, partial [Gemmataceae bacterium]|nr:hypothetical protein [Gemmataceae bacterium]